MDLWFARMSRISEIRTGASVDLDQRLMGPVPHKRTGLGRMGRGLCAVVGTVLPHPHRDLNISLGILSQRGKPRCGGAGFS